jgi:hypothetical protein
LTQKYIIVKDPGPRELRIKIEVYEKGEGGMFWTRFYGMQYVGDGSERF